MNAKALGLKLEEAFTSQYWRWEYLDTSTLPKNLLTALLEQLPQISADSWPGRLELGGIYINGKPAQKLDTALPLPCCLEYYEPKFDIERAASHYPSFNPEQIVFQDEDIVVVYKPAGLPSMPSRDQVRYSLKGQLETHLGKKIHMPSRLDMSAQGLVIVSTSERMNAKLQHCFEHRQVEKVYLLSSAHVPSWREKTVNAAIGYSSLHRVLREIDGAGAKQAETRFQVLGTTADGQTLIAARPRTGRTHQIRVHSLHAGVPIVGDKFYSSFSAPQLCLLSARIVLQHPFKQTQLKVEIPEQFKPSWVPKDLAY